MATDGEQIGEENGDTNLQVDCFNTDPYEKKYFALLRRCESIQQNNERLVNRIHHVQKLLRRLRQERRLLMKRLDQHGDDYLSVPVSFPAVEESDSYTTLPSPSVKTTKPPSSDVGVVGGPPKKKIKVENKKGNSNSSPFYLFSQSHNSTPLNEDIKSEIKSEFTNEELGKTFTEGWGSEEKKNLFYTSILLYDIG
uniref:INO80 complex subunit F domain-containing protein n=1 Tax=Strigamia maritima TaxID=126957 RepID=T1ILZ9_STRMM